MKLSVITRFLKNDPYNFFVGFAFCHTRAMPMNGAPPRRGRMSQLLHNQGGKAHTTQKEPPVKERCCNAKNRRR